METFLQPARPWEGGRVRRGVQQQTQISSYWIDWIPNSLYLLLDIAVYS